jgi:hypothetical protein
VPLSALALVLAAAALHATWNVLLARARDVRAATTVALIVSVVLFAPVAAVTWDVEAEAVPWIALSSALELAYFFLLSRRSRGTPSRATSRACGRNSAPAPSPRGWRRS